MTARLFVIAALLGAAGCKRTSDASGPEALQGQWRAVLHSPGGELPFGLEITAEGAFVTNAAERIGPLPVETTAGSVTIGFPHYDSEITAAIGAELAGQWRHRTPEGHSVLRFTARRGGGRFLGVRGPPVAGAPPSIAGRWRAVFRDSGGGFAGVAELGQGGTRVTGTILTPTGDFRYLDGYYQSGRLRLSTFDGAHAFLIAAEVSGGAMTGIFWSSDNYQATFRARPMKPDEKALPDPFNEVAVTSVDGRFRFAFADLEGRVVSSEDPRFRGKVVLVEIFGTWCPNCNDAAPLLARWHREYRGRGLEVVGLAFEFTGHRERDTEMLGRFKERHRIEYPLLLAGTSYKTDAGEVLGDLSAVKSYPTHVFIGRDGKVRTIHSGFTGPGTGAHHAELVRELEDEIRSLLAERLPDGVNKME